MVFKILFYLQRDPLRFVVSTWRNASSRCTDKMSQSPDAPLLHCGQSPLQFYMFSSWSNASVCFLGVP